MDNNLFSDLKIIELANVLAGPAVGMFFAELGAQVIKIENPVTGGDVTRNWKLPQEPESGLSAYYCAVNWNKEVRFIDLSTKEGQDEVYQLIREADIVISNFKKGDAEKLSMDYKSITKINPQIIYGHISGFGEDSSRVAYDLILQAETGFMSMNGTPESGPVKMPVALIDILAAHQMKEALLIALIKKIKTGKGSYASTSLYDTALSSLANQASNWLMAGYIPQRMGSLHPNIAPYGEIFTTKDNKQLVLAIGNDKQFKTLCKILKADNLPVNSKYETNTLRVANRISLKSELQKVFSTFDKNAIYDKLIDHNIPVGILKNLQEVFDNQQTKKIILTDTSPNTDGLNERVKSIAFEVC